VGYFRRPSHWGRKGRIDPVRARRRESASTRVICALGLSSLLLLVGHRPLAAQESAPRVALASADIGCAGPGNTSSSRSTPVYHLLPEDPAEDAVRLASADLETDLPLQLGLGRPRPTEAPSLVSADALALRAPAAVSWTRPCPTHRLLAAADTGESPARVMYASLLSDYFPSRFDQPETEVPRWSFLERHRTLFSTLIPIVSIGAVTANSLVAYDTNHPFRIHEEGWFGEKTVNGGADKASHLTDYYVIASLFEDTYKMLGYSKNEAIMWGVGVAIATGLANEVSDGFTRHGFSFEDLAMDSGGAVAAGLVSVTNTRDLLGMRTSHLPSSTYTHDVYSADFKFSGLAERLGVNLGPLRWLLFSVTYNAKGYRVQPPEEHQRQLGFEIGLNLQQILFDLKVSRGTWWGYPLHLVADNIRFPFTAVGMRVDLNRGKWLGPNSGNFD
jgi:hypothetical protein